MGFLSVLALFFAGCAACCVAVGAFAAAWSVANAKYKKQLHAATARYDAAIKQAQQEAGGGGAPGDGGGGGGVAAVYESFTLGWLNLLVQHLWLPVLEKLVSSIAAEKLQLILNEVLRKFSDRIPWKYIQTVAVEVVTFGLAPPQFQFCTAKYDPSRSYLLLTMDMTYHSSGFQAVLTPRLRPMGPLKQLSVRLEIMQLRLAGKLHLGLHLTKEPPGIKGIDYSFAGPPEFDIQASPVGYLGLPGELPGLVAQLRSVLQRVLNRRLVEPSRRYLDLQRIYRNKHVQRIGGPGGCLRVCVIGGRNLMYGAAGASAVPTTSGTAAAAGTSGTSAGASAPAGGLPPASPFTTGASGASGVSDCDPYVELRFGREVFRTPIVHRTADPVFNWQFDIKLHEDLPPPPAPTAPSCDAPPAPPLSARYHGAPSAAAGGAGQVLLVFRVLNARTIGEPEVLSSGILDVAALGLAPNADPRARLLGLTGPGSVGPRGSLSLQVSWLKAQPKKPSPFPEDAERAAAAAVAAAAAAGAAAVAASASGSAPNAAWGAGPGSSALPSGMPTSVRRPQPAGSPLSSSTGTPAQMTPDELTPADSIQRQATTTPGAGADAGSAWSRRSAHQVAGAAAEVVMSFAREAAGSGPMASGELLDDPSVSRQRRMTASSTSSRGAAAPAADPSANDSAAADGGGNSPRSSAGSARGLPPLGPRRPAGHSIASLTTEVTLADGAVLGISPRQPSPSRPSRTPIRLVAHSGANGGGSSFGVAYEQAAVAAGGGGAAAVNGGNAHTALAEPSPVIGRGSRGSLGRGSGSSAGGGRKASRTDGGGGGSHRRSLSGLLGKGAWRPLLWGGGGGLSARGMRGRTGAGDESTELAHKTHSATAAASPTAVHRVSRHAAHHNRAPTRWHGGSPKAGATAAASAGGAATTAGDGAGASLAPRRSATITATGFTGLQPVAANGANGAIGRLPSMPPTPNPADGSPSVAAAGYRLATAVTGTTDDGGDGGPGWGGHTGPPPASASASARSRGGGANNASDEGVTSPATSAAAGAGAAESATTAGAAAAAAAGPDGGDSPALRDGSARGGRGGVVVPSLALGRQQSLAQVAHGSPGLSPQASGPEAQSERSRNGRVGSAAALAAGADGAGVEGAAGQGNLSPLPRAQDTPFVRASLQACSSGTRAGILASGGTAAGGPTRAAAATAATGIQHLGSLSGSLAGAAMSFGAVSHGSSHAGTPLATAGPSTSTASGGGGPAAATATPHGFDTLSLLAGLGNGAGGAGGAMTVSDGAAGGGSGGTASTSSAGAPQWSSTMQSLAQVIKLQRLLQEKQAANQELAAALRDARRRCETLERLRRWENHRALMEGGRFSLHMGREELDRADLGAALFPNPSAWQGVVAALGSAFLGRGRAAPPPPDPLRCFSLVLRGGRCLHLQLPASGNGRSRDEWVDAIKDVSACVREGEERGAAPGGGRREAALAADSVAAGSGGGTAGGAAPAGSKLQGAGGSLASAAGSGALGGDVRTSA
ncbi:hypothetical protein GPECTOR_3g194 [Gonium pectorale]|uniref:SMP-LTD domain-containing protein n=1 Tax=Gonium pectorale TaxID=33097 RepID=A0A150GZ64_GONPE|nr:hypothetical protein GPECTOR_3g194 [Gonium pectorale]|eukprot:KXZ55033.1 hypothetical protein GPECTOR_3g194 [Gonium pectorale]